MPAPFSRAAISVLQSLSTTPEPSCLSSSPVPHINGIRRHHKIDAQDDFAAQLRVLMR